MKITHGGNIFAIARERGWDWKSVLDLSASINPLGPAPGVRPAVEAALDRIAHYPCQGPGQLEEALAAVWKISPDQILAGGGATELIHFVARSGWNGPTAMATPVWSEFYRVFPYALKVSAAEPETWPQRGLLVLSQPMNPTGEAIAEETLRRAIAGREGPVLIDESFIEFTRLESAVWWTEHHPNLLVLRSLSKFHALAGLRVGALVGSREWMDRLSRRREPWQVNGLAEAAALAAISDSGHAERTRLLVEEERQYLLEQLSDMPGVSVTPGVANFLFVSTTRPAADICEQFLEKRIILRNCTGLPGVEGEAIRFAVRTRPENDRFLAAARECLCEG
ncbi:MAG: histidinol-phosphate aminotransferase family protein [Acidobacteria bacterium]|nr:histidinol-phosphate aminotransferase family protein [Acidobacteriota bacterium]